MINDGQINELSDGSGRYNVVHPYCIMCRMDYWQKCTRDVIICPGACQTNELFHREVSIIKIILLNQMHHYCQGMTKSWHFLHLDIGRRKNNWQTSGFRNGQKGLSMRVTFANWIWEENIRYEKNRICVGVFCKICKDLRRPYIAFMESLLIPGSAMSHLNFVQRTQPQ